MAEILKRSVHFGDFQEFHCCAKRAARKSTLRRQRGSKGSCARERTKAKRTVLLFFL